jgi:uncharacterized protein
MRPLPFTPEELRAFCTRWQIAELSLFGSVLREDFGPDSDVDVLVRFAPEAPWSLFELAEMKLELEDHFGRPVDVVEVEGLRNPYRRRRILETRRVIHAA